MPVAAKNDQIGRYRTICRIGRGGMAEVFLAAHEPMPGSQRLVAIKRILSSLVEDSSFLEMFLDEARVLSRLYHPNLDRVLDAGKHEGVPYIVLDYLPGRDLGIILRAHEKRELLPLDVSLHVAARVAAGLAHAHGLKDERGSCLGIVHRDVSPENIIITFEGTVKVVDFGVARGTMRTQETAPGLIKGKPSFMAPEQLLAHRIDHRADIFALGVLLYRLTVGRHPFGIEGDDASTFRRLLEVVPTPPHLLQAGYPRTLSAVVMKALERDPTDRHETADGFLADVEGVMHDERWFPSDRRLSLLMGELFPAAAAAARRLSVRPRDAEAAKQASYLTRGDIRLDIDLGDDDDDDTEMATAPGGPASPREPSTKDSGSMPPLGASDDVATATDRSSKPPSEMDSVTAPSDPADMDSVTDPSGPADIDSVTASSRGRQKKQRSRPRPARGSPRNESRRPSSPAGSVPSPRDTSPSFPKGGDPKQAKSPVAKRGLQDSRLDSTAADRLDDMSATRSKTPPLPLDSRLDDDSQVTRSTPPPPLDSRLDDDSQVTRSTPPPSLDSRLDDDSYVTQQDPPPPLDSRLVEEPGEDREASFSGLSTRPGMKNLGEQPMGADSEHEDETAVEPPPSSRDAKGYSGVTAPTHERPTFERSSSAALERPPWRTPAGVAITVVIGVSVALAISLAVCGG